MFLVHHGISRSQIGKAYANLTQAEKAVIKISETASHTMEVWNNGNVLSWVYRGELATGEA